MRGSSTIGKKIIFLIFSNILWGFIPLPSSSLMEQYSSFIIIFFRFLIMSVVLLSGTMILIFYQARKNPQKKITLKDLLNYLKSENTAFFSWKQWVYLMILSVFGLNFLTIFYFFGLKFLGAIITSIGIMFSLIASTLINWGLGKERMSNFKLLYLFTLMGAIVILIIGGDLKNLSNTSMISPVVIIFIILIFGSATTFFIISGSTDKFSPKEYRVLKINPSYHTVRTIFKLGILSGFSAIFLILLLIPLHFISFPTSISSEISSFWIQLREIKYLMKIPSFYILIFGCTILPYLIYYFSASTWPKNSSFDLWAGVLQLVEPIISMILGISLLNEEFPISYLLVIIFLLFIAIILKFISETEAQIFVVFFIKVIPQKLKNVQKKIMENREIKEIYNLIGEYDIYTYAQFPTSKSLNQFLLHTIQQMEGIELFKMQIITDFAFDRS